MPVTATCETFTLVAPVFVRVTVCDWVVPSATLPKDSLGGFVVTAPAAVVVPVPLRLTLVCASEASLPIVIVALKAPAALGENVRLTVVLCPAAIDAGRLGEVRVKYLVEIAALVMLTVPEPVFDAVIVRVLLLPATTLPKEMDPLAKESVPTGCVVFPALTP